MAASPDALEGISVCALILSVFASACCGWLVMRFRIIEERLQRTLDENGVVRKKFLPGEVFAVPALAGDASEARLREIEAKLASALGELKAVKQDAQDMEDKLVQMERRVSSTESVKMEIKKPESEGFLKKSPKYAPYLNGTSSTLADVVSMPKVPDVSEKAVLPALDVKTAVAAIDHTNVDRSQEKQQPDTGSSQFSIMADIGKDFWLKGQTRLLVA
jgi:hypothetical protein